jgi:hypothetical protein
MFAHISRPNIYDSEALFNHVLTKGKLDLETFCALTANCFNCW